MKSFLLSLLLCLAPLAHGQLVDSNLQAAQSELDNYATQVTNDQNAITTLQTTLAQDSAQIQQLQQQLANATASATVPYEQLQFPGAGLTQHVNLQHHQITLSTGTQGCFRLAAGTAANTGATGSTGTGTFVLNSDDTVTTSISPNGPYYDTFWYCPFAGTWQSNNLGIPAPDKALTQFTYHVEYFLDSANYPLSQALEGETRWYDGTHMYQMAFQIEMHSHLIRYYSPGVGWVSTGVSFTMPANQWVAIDGVYQVDPNAGTTTMTGLYINGVYHPLNLKVNAAAKSVTPWMHASFQLDSNSSGAYYVAGVRNISVGWIRLQ